MVSYTKQTWINGPDGLTPLAAARLNHMEDGIAAAITADILGNYVTDDELADALIAQMAGIHSVPAGGATGYALLKNSNADYDMQWGPVSGGGGGYSPPVGGIPKTDLSSSVQASLGKADTALQSIPSTYTTDDELAAAIASITLLSLGAAPLNSPAFTGIPTAPTAAVGTNSNQVASTAHVKASIDALIDGAPGTLDTLNQIAQQLNANGSAVDALNAAISTKVPMTRTINGYDLSQDRVLVKADIGLGNVDNTSDTSKLFTMSQITDATATGKSVLGAANAAAARSAIGASNLVIGTTAGTAADAAALATSLAGKEPTVASGTTTQYYRGDKAWATLNSAAISDATSLGRSVLTAVNAAAARSAIGAGTSNLAVGTTATDAKAGNWVPASTDISDSTTLGRTLITIADAASARAAIGAGTSNLTIGTVANTAADAGAMNTALAAKASTASLASYAPLASPAFTGAPTAPTASAGTSTTQLATTAFVQAAITTAPGNLVIGMAHVGWDKNAGKWASARPSISGQVVFWSLNDAAATRPADLAPGDGWMQNPNATP